MGVPSLFAHLSSKYKTIFTKPGSHTLCLDFNALIHTSNKKREVDECIMFENLKKMINEIVKTVKPRVLLIATDGVAPRAKMNQQRARRYVAAEDTMKSGKKFFIEGKIKKTCGKEVEVKIDHEENSRKLDAKNNDAEEFPSNKNQTSFNSDTSESTINNGATSNESFTSVIDEILDEFDSSSDAEVWDSNCITPGTPFMFRLESMLDSFFILMLNTNADWKGLTLVYSSSRVPGEGEHKIMHFIKRTRPSSCTIYSPDADVLFLSMNLPTTVKVMREDTIKKKCTKCDQRGHNAVSCEDPSKAPHVYVNIDELKKCVIRDIKMGMTNVVNDSSRIISDFVFVNFLCGNDFLPTLPCFDVRFEAVEMVCQVLVQLYNSKGKYIIDKDGNINFEVLQSFFAQLSRKEDGLYSLKAMKLREMRKRWDIKGSEEISMENNKGKIEYYKNKLFRRIGPDTSEQTTGSFVEKETLSMFDNDFLTARAEVAKHYLTGLAWTNALYQKGLLSWVWFYPYHYAPLASDLALVTNFKPSFTMGSPLSGLEQALLVLPPPSKFHLPEPLHPIFDTCHFPTQFTIDMFDKLLPWQGTVLLPFVNVNDVRDLFRKYKKGLGVEDLAQNMEGTNLLYVHGSKRVGGRRWWHGKSVGECVDGIVNEYGCYVYEDGMKV